MHHPDSPQCRDLPATVRRARFQSITHAYDGLRGKKGHYSQTHDPYLDEIMRMKRAQNLRRAAYAETQNPFGPEWTASSSDSARRKWDASPDDRWKDRVLICVGVLVCPSADRAPFSLSATTCCLHSGRALGTGSGPVPVNNVRWT